MFAIGRAKGRSKDVLKAVSQCLHLDVQKDILRTF